MPRLVSLSRAAKLVGISRGEMQKKVLDQELLSFEGQVSLDDIEKLFPDAEIEDNHIIEDLEKIIEQAMNRARGEKLAKLLSPSPHTLAARAQAISKDLARSKNQVKELVSLFTEVQTQVNELSLTSDKPHLFEDLNNWIDDSLEKVKSHIINPTPLLDKDTVLRIIAAQVHIKNTGHEFFVDGSNTILEAGLSAGLALNYGCSNGNCGKCKAKLISGKIKKTKPHDFVFSESEKLQNYFLCCSNTAITDIEIEADEAGSEKDIPQQNISAKVKKVEKPSAEVLVLNLKTPRTKRLRFLAGQNVVLNRANLAALEIPVASCPCDDMNIQLHIPTQSNHPFTQYILNELNTSDSIHIKGPTGSFVLDEDSNKPLIFIAFDTGFAPIKSLIEHAVTLEHSEFIHLYWLHSDTKPYMHNQCRAWEDALDNFKYQQAQNNSLDIPALEKNLESLVEKYPDFSEINIFICGPEKMVKKTRQVLLDHNANKEQLKTQIL